MKEITNNQFLLGIADQVSLSKITIIFFFSGTAKLIGLIQVANSRDKGRSEIILNIFFDSFTIPPKF